jgi:predicted dinucleotide-utilizing enzyme
VGVGVIGAGVISRYYLENITRFPDLHVHAIADLDHARARARGDEFGLTALAVEDLLAREDIEIVLNLTVPAAHFAVSMQILERGKHVWSEKPIALSWHEAAALLDEADRCPFTGSRRTFPPSAPRGVGVSASWTSLARFAPASRNAPRAPSPTTCSTSSSASTKPPTPGSRSASHRP